MIHFSYLINNPLAVIWHPQIEALTKGAWKMHRLGETRYSSTKGFHVAPSSTGVPQSPGNSCKSISCWKRMITAVVTACLPPLRAPPQLQRHNSNGLLKKIFCFPLLLHHLRQVRKQCILIPYGSGWFQMAGVGWRPHAASKSHPQIFLFLQQRWAVNKKGLNYSKKQGIKASKIQPCY